MKTAKQNNLKMFVWNIYQQKDKLWFLIWLSGIGSLWLWDKQFLNAPALAKVEAGFLNTLMVAILVIGFSALLGWAVALGLHFLEKAANRLLYLMCLFILNIIRSVPQIITILLGYIVITFLIRTEILRSSFAIILCIALVISSVVFLEIADLIRERIQYFTRRDFYNAMRVCGIPERQILNREILWKNSLRHIFNKLISVFGAAIFLQCSIDFVVSVGLSTRVSAVNLPVTLGSLLAKIDSKQDILAIGHTLSEPGYVQHLFFEHLQGITVAFLIVFTLLCIYKISNGFSERYEH